MYYGARAFCVTIFALFCTSLASKLRTSMNLKKTFILTGVSAHVCSVSCVSMCTFVLVKQVN